MAVSIDTVYQRVLAIANKEQRGYITPQEFNLFANQAQMDLFEQYFHDINQVNRVPGNQTEYSNHLDILNEKINLFEMIGDCPRLVDGSVAYQSFRLPLVDNFYRLGTVKHKPINENIITDPWFNAVSTVNNLTNNTSDLQTFADGDVYQTTTLGYVAVNTFHPNKVSPSNTHASATSELKFLDGTGVMAGDQIFIRMSNINPQDTYKLTFEVTSYTQGKICAHLATKNTATGQTIYHSVSPYIEDTGTYSFYMEGTEVESTFHYNNIFGNGTGVLTFWAQENNTAMTIDNVSLKKVSPNWSIDSNHRGWRIGGDLKVSNTSLITNSFFTNQTLYVGEKDTSRISKVNGSWAFGGSMGSINASYYLNWNYTLEAGQTYRISFQVNDATQGSLSLHEQLQETFDYTDHASELYPGLNDSLLLYNYNQDSFNKFVDVYWQQSANSNTRISIRKSGGFDGSITKLSVRLVEDDAKSIEIEPVNENELTYMLQTKLACPTLDTPVYARRNNLLNVYPYTIIDGVSCNYIRRPNKVKWGYYEVNGTALYNSSESDDFELHESEEVNLVFKILKLAGISIEDPQLYNIAGREDMLNIQQEKM